MISNEFDFLAWLYEIRLQSSALEAFDEMVSDSDAKATHLDSKLPLPVKPKESKHIIYGAELIRAATEIALSSAHTVYRRQMVVVAASLVEGLTRDFFTKLFLEHPSRMHQFIHPENAENSIGMVRFNELLTQSKDDLMSALAKRSAKRLADLPFPKAIKKMAELSDGKVDSIIQHKINEITELRNKIVHENDQSNLDRETLKSYFISLEELATWCAERLESSGVQVRRVFKQ